jgi:O-antigen ligase
MDDGQDAAGRWGQWLLAIFAAILILASLVLCGSRGGLLSAVLSNGILFAALWKRIRPRALAWSVVVALPLFAALLLAWIGIDSLRAGIPEGSLEREASFHSRQVIWHQVVDHLPQAGVAGFGLGTFEASFAPYTPPGTATRWDKAHNDFLQIAWETGIAGGLLIVWGTLFFLLRYVAAALRSPAHETDLFRVAIAAGLTSLVLHSLVDFNLQIGSNGFLFALLAGLLVALHRSAGRGRIELGGGPRLIGLFGERRDPAEAGIAQEPSS